MHFQTKFCEIAFHIQQLNSQMMHRWGQHRSERKLETLWMQARWAIWRLFAFYKCKVGDMEVGLFGRQFVTGSEWRATSCSWLTIVPPGWSVITGTRINPKMAMNILVMMHKGHPATSTLLYPGSLLFGSWDDHHRNPSSNTEII